MTASAPKPPPAPDYASIARQEAAGNLDLARSQAEANRINQYNPFYSVTYSHNPGGAQDQYTSESYFDPDKYSAAQTPGTLDWIRRNYGSVENWWQQRGLAEHGGQLPENYTSTRQVLSGQYNNPDKYYQQFTPGDFLQKLIAEIQGQPTNLDTSNLPGLGTQSTYDAILSRVRPDIERNKELLQSRLAAQGLTPGSAAYNRDLLEQSRGENDLFLQAELQGYQVDAGRRQQALQELLQQRSYPIQVLQSILSGSAPPTLQPGQQQYVPGPDLTGAASNQYQDQIDRYNLAVSRSNQASPLGAAIGGGLGALGGSFLGNPGLGAQLGGSLGGQYLKF